MNTFCSYFNQQECRSCQWIETRYEMQLLQKESFLRAVLKLSDDFHLEKTVPSPLTGFRNRAKMMVTGTVQKPIIGLVGEENLDQGRELLHCPIHHPKLNEVIASLPEFIRESNLIPYHIESRKGELKGLILFHSPDSNQTYLRFILRSKECVSRIKKFLPQLQSHFPHLTCISANIQPIPHAVLEGREELFLTEQNHIDHKMGNLTLKLSPQAFVQTNTEVATKLYQTVADWIAEINPDKMLELFCGQGAFSFFAAKNAKQILGIEINESAVQQANQTAKELGFSHLSFECLDASTSTLSNADLLLVNPPRRGLGKSIEVIQRELPKHLIYSSCSVESLAKDLDQLSTQYKLKNACIFDLFPHTSHFEILTKLDRQ